jgi:hypothetical protein
MSALSVLLGVLVLSLSVLGFRWAVRNGILRF